ncbi:MAG: glutamyl-tRNA reductase [Candidatus Nezhaarchaeales archaeon]
MKDVAALLIGHGSTNPSQKRVLEGLARIVKSKGVFGEVFYAFMRVNEPKLSDILHKIVEKGYRKVVAIPVFVSEGSHTIEDIPDALKIPRGARYCKREVDGVEVEIIYARPLDVDERIADVVIDRGLEALRGFYGNYEATGTDPLSDLYCYAITHKKASIGILDKCQVHDLTDLKHEIKVEELVVLQTCNRVEVYFVGTEENLRLLENFFSSKLGFSVEGYSEIMRGLDAARHLYRVACSLESMFIGEEEILGQVKNALIEAEKKGTVGGKLRMLFQGAIMAGKRARRETAISYGAVSVPSVAVKKAEQLLGSLRDKTALVVGAGTVGEFVVKELAKRGTNLILIANRTFDRAVKLAEKFYGYPVRLDEKELPDYIAKADVVFVATRAPHLIIKTEHVENALRINEHRLIIFDLAVPRNVDETLRSKPSVEVYTIDELRVEAEENLRARIKEVPKVEKIIEEELSKLRIKLLKLNEVKRAKHVMEVLEEVRREEVEKALKKLMSKGDPNKVIELFSKSLVKKVARELIKVINDRVNEHGDMLSELRKILGG